MDVDWLRAGHWQARVRASNRLVRRLLATAAAVTLAAVLLLVLAAQARPALRQLPQPPARMVTALLPDPLGCPSNTRCYDRLFAPPDLVTGFSTWFPGGTVLAGHATYGLLGDDRFEAELLGRSGTASVLLRTLCVPGGQTRSSLHRSTTGSDGRGVHLVVVAQGRPGCTAAVTVDDPAPGRQLEAAALGLAADPGLQAGQ